jgi:hypothetical protein
MPTNNPFNFDYSYLSLPEKFYSLVNLFPSPEIFLVNDSLKLMKIEAMTSSQR